MGIFCLILKRLRILKFTIVISGILTANFAFSVCSTQNAYTAQVPLQPATFTAGVDMPVGTNIRLQYVQGYRQVKVVCNNSTSTAYNRMRLTGGTLYSGQTNIYQTGITGLGAKFYSPVVGKYYPFNTTYLGTGNPDGWLAFVIVLVNMGPVTSGSFNPALLPTVIMDAVDNDNVPVIMASHKITGSFTLQAASCITPNFNWNLGTTNTSVLKNPGDSSAWVDTPVTLTGCPAFLGNNSNVSYTQYVITGTNSGTTTQSGTLAQNTLTMTLTPNTTAIDSANGIIALDSSATAKGFAVQLGTKQSGSYSAQSLSGNMIVTPTLGDNSGTIVFPLGARITRTSTTATGGSISSSVTYTITYQ